MSILTAKKAGAKGDSASSGTGTNDTTALQNLINDAAGKHCYIEPASGGAYRITDRLLVPAGTYVELHRDAVIRQETKWKPVFDVYDAPDCTIRGGELRWEGSHSSTDEPVSLRGAPARDYFAGVWTNSHRTRIDTKVYGMFTSTTISGYDTTANAWQSYRTKDCVVERLEFENVNMGVLAGGYDRLTIGTLFGQIEDYVPAAGIPNTGWIAGHALYTTDNGAFNSRGLDCGLVQTYDSVNTRAAVQLRNLREVTIGKINCRNTQGPLAFAANVTDAVIGEIMSYDDNGDSLVGAGSINHQDNTSQRIVIGTCHIHMKDARRALGAGGIDNTINQLIISQDPSVDFANRRTAIYYGATGVRYTIGHLRYIGRSAAASGHNNVCHIEGTDFVVRDAQGINHNQMFSLLAASVGAKIGYDPELMTPQPNGSDTRKFSINTTYPTNPKLILKPSRKAYSTTGGAAVTPIMGDQTIVALSINATNAFTINAVTDAVPGTDLTFELFNNAGGAVGTITWNAVYKFHDPGTAVTAPSAGNRKSVTFHFDGTNWIERHRSG